MDCPYCGKEMTSGFIRSDRYIVWSEKKRRFIPVSYNTDIFLHDSPSTDIPAFRCEFCKKIIFNYTEN